jgi:hypothetical protein
VQAIICLAVACVEVAGASSEFVDDAIVELGFESAQRVDLEAGAIISVGLPFAERQSNELMVGAAMMLVRRPLEVVTEALIGDEMFLFNTDILDFRALGSGSASRAEIEAGFRDIGYTEVENAEVSKLLNVERGNQFNLSEDEIAQFRSIQGAGDRAREQVSGVLTNVLRQRFQAYLEGGLSAVEPYARKKNRNASPRQELETAFSSLKLVKRHFPAFFTSLSRLPAQLPADTDSQFYWLKRVSEERPAYVLSHRMVERKNEHTVAMELQFYVQHSYNSMLTLVAGVPVEEGTLVLSAIRVFTDQVTGFGSSIKKDVGRKRVVKAMTDYFREMREALESQSANSWPKDEDAIGGQIRARLLRHRHPAARRSANGKNRLL